MIIGPRKFLMILNSFSQSTNLVSDAILRVIGRQGASVLVRVMGLILCSLAVEIVLTALNVGPWTPVAPH
jgi:small neutral amino acid transporter SnatA (MarC family)